jgi:hypothetical protein
MFLFGSKDVSVTGPYAYIQTVNTQARKAKDTVSTLAQLTLGNVATVQNNVTRMRAELNNEISKLGNDQNLTTTQVEVFTDAFKKIDSIFAYAQEYINETKSGIKSSTIHSIEQINGLAIITAIERNKTQKDAYEALINDLSASIMALATSITNTPLHQISSLKETVENNFSDITGFLSEMVEGSKDLTKLQKKDFLQTLAKTNAKMEEMREALNLKTKTFFNDTSSDILYFHEQESLMKRAIEKVSRSKPQVNFIDIEKDAQTVRETRVAAYKEALEKVFNNHYSKLIEDIELGSRPAQGQNQSETCVVQ